MIAASAGEIADNLARVRTRIDAAAKRASRDARSITLVAVSKLQPVAMVRAAYAAGQRHFGENYVQELVAKRTELADLRDIVWHMIGHVQTNKARDVVRSRATVHTVDSPRLATELGKRATIDSTVMPVLVQVNVGGEAQKAGCSPRDLESMIESIRATAGVSLAGLMTVPPHTEDPDGAQVYFRVLSELRDAHGGAAALPDLSMGMTHDLEVAIASGATIVRVGTAIFGGRPQ